MSVTSNDVANQAITAMGGNQPLVVGNAPNFDNSTAGKALARIYTPCVQTVMREWEWDFSRNTIALVVTGVVRGSNRQPDDWQPAAGRLTGVAR